VPGVVNALKETYPRALTRRWDVGVRGMVMQTVSRERSLRTQTLSASARSFITFVACRVSKSNISTISIMIRRADSLSRFVVLLMIAFSVS